MEDIVATPGFVRSKSAAEYPGGVGRAEPVAVGMVTVSVATAALEKKTANLEDWFVIAEASRRFPD
jgi:hypothetical protein